MKIDMRPEAVTRRLRQVEQLRRLCLSLSSSSAGRDIARRYPDNERVQRTNRSLPATHRFSAPGGVPTSMPPLERTEDRP